jgi:hypothetical protein
MVCPVLQCATETAQLGDAVATSDERVLPVAEVAGGGCALTAWSPQKTLQKSADFALTSDFAAIPCSSADGGPGLPGCSSLAQREPRFVGFNERAAFVVERGEGRSIFDSAILDFVITTDFFNRTKFRR